MLDLIAPHAQSAWPQSTKVVGAITPNTSQDEVTASVLPGGFRVLTPQGAGTPSARSRGWELVRPSPYAELQEVSSLVEFGNVNMGRETPEVAPVPAEPNPQGANRVDLPGRQMGPGHHYGPGVPNAKYRVEEPPGEPACGSPGDGRQIRRDANPGGRRDRVDLPRRPLDPGAARRSLRPPDRRSQPGRWRWHGPGTTRSCRWTRSGNRRSRRV